MEPDRGVVWLAPPPPPRVLKAMNIVARPLLRSRLGKHFPGVMLLQFQGRRTGRVMRIPVNFNLVLECRRCGEVKAPPGPGAAVTGPTT